MALSKVRSLLKSEPANESSRVLAAIGLALIALILAVFGQCVTFDFVNYDDRIFVTKNEHVLRGLTLDNILWALTAGGTNRDLDIDYWRPLSMMSHMLDVQLFGLSAGWHHAVSIGIHALATVALLIVLHAMTGTIWRSAFVAAVFAVHPLHVESVAWVAERKDVLSGLFFFFTLGAYIRFVRRPFHLQNYLLVLFLFLLGLMSKPMLVTLPCVLLVLDWWPLNRMGLVPWKRLALEKVPMFAMSAAVCVITSNGPGGSAEDMMAAVALPWRAANAMDSYLAYLRQTFWPTSLACFYPHPGQSLAQKEIALSAFVFLAVSATAAVWWRRRYAAAGWLWFLGMLTPVIGLLQSGLQSRADRYMYLPMIGLTIAVAWAAADWARQGQVRRRITASGAIAILIALSLTAHRQTTHWRNGESLWTHTLAVTKDNANAHNYFGLALMEKGRITEAIEMYQRALRIRPDYAEAHGNLGAALFPHGKQQEAIAHMRKAVTLDPRVAGFHYNLGNALLQNGQIEAAVDPLETALKLDPTYGVAANNLAFIRFQQGRRDEAIALYRRVAELNPRSAEAERNLGYALLRSGFGKEAVRHYEKSVDLEPAGFGGLSSFAWVLATSPDTNVRNGARAVELALRARQLSESKDPMILRTLAAAYAEAGQFQPALTTTDSALELAIALKDDQKIRALREVRPYFVHLEPVRDQSLSPVP